MTGIVFSEQLVRTIVQVSKTGSVEEVRLAMAVLQHVLRQTPGGPVECCGFRAANASDDALSRVRSAARLRVLVEDAVGRRQQLLVSVADDAHRINVCAQQQRSRSQTLAVGTVRGPRACVLEVLDVDRVGHIRFYLWILNELEKRFAMGHQLRDSWVRYVIPKLCAEETKTSPIKVSPSPLCSLSR